MTGMTEGVSSLREVNIAGIVASSSIASFHVFSMAHSYWDLDPCRGLDTTMITVSFHSDVQGQSVLPRVRVCLLKWANKKPPNITKPCG